MDLERQSGDEVGKKEESKPVPAIPANSTIEVDLPVGSFDLSGVYYRKVLTKPLTGEARKEISKPSILNNSGKLVTESLFHLCEFPHIKFSDPNEKRVTIRAMHSADRAAIILANRKISRPNTPFEQMTDCPYCGARLTISTDPSEIEMVRIEDTDYTRDDQEKEFILPVKANNGDIARFTLSRGFQEEQMPPDVMKNPGESATIILAACCKDYNGKKVSSEFFDAQVVSITDQLFSTFSGNQPGPEVLVPFKCSECRRTLDLPVDVADFLLPNVRRKAYIRHGKK